jgi:hypothetical protein
MPRSETISDAVNKRRISRLYQFFGKPINEQSVISKESFIEKKDLYQSLSHNNLLPVVVF